MTQTTTDAVPTVAGARFGGGIYAGRIFVVDEAYALIAATKDGDLDPLPWADQPIDGATDYADGLANTDALAAAGSKLAGAIRALRIGDHADWYLPSRLEALILFSELGTKSSAAFKRDLYWTSTRHASDASHACCQGFYFGSQYLYRHLSKLRARAVRRVKL